MAGDDHGATGQAGMTVWVWVAVVAVGGGGAVSRFMLDAIISGRAGRAFPFGTLTINLTGSLLLGLLTGLGVSGNLMLILGTATLGSFTTFSTWMLETHRLAEDGETQRALMNLAVSLLLGFGAAVLGRAIGAAL